MYCFIKVVGEDGVFYDYVGEWLADEHIAQLKKRGMMPKKSQRTKCHHADSGFSMTLCEYGMNVPTLAARIFILT